jgi:hypothetical protein
VRIGGLGLLSVMICPVASSFVFVFARMLREHTRVCEYSWSVRAALMMEYTWCAALMMKYTWEYTVVHREREKHTHTEWSTPGVHQWSTPGVHQCAALMMEYTMFYSTKRVHIL